MPFTPFHMGPGLAAKALLGRHFSLTVFGVSQVAMDLEPLVRMFRGDGLLHGVTHTYLGATVIAIVCVAAGRLAGQLLLDCWKPDGQFSLLRWLRGPERISWRAAAAGSFIGAYSHVFVDSFMHSEMRPLMPLTSANALAGVVSIDSLHFACMASGAAGALLMLAMFVVRRGGH